MYIVTAINGTEKTIIHSANIINQRVDGSVSIGINTIASCTFTIYANNAGYDKITERSTRIKVYNTKTAKTDFYGRVLLIQSDMTDAGLHSKVVTCESVLAYLCDTVSAKPKSYNTVEKYIKGALDNHNSQCDFKIFPGSITHDITAGSIGWDYTTTWDIIKTNLVDIYGGELRLTITADNAATLDYVDAIGELKATAIVLGKNLKSINVEVDASNVASRIIPLGAKKEGSEERVGISDINNDKPYIVDPAIESLYGISYKVITSDDYTDAVDIMAMGQYYIANSNKVARKISISALDLSLIGLDSDTFEIGCQYRITQKIIGIDEYFRLLEITTDINNPQESTLTFGNKRYTLTDATAELSAGLDSKANTADVDKQLADIKTVMQIDYCTNTTISSNYAELTRLAVQVSGTTNLLISAQFYMLVTTAGIIEFWVQRNDHTIHTVKDYFDVGYHFKALVYPIKEITTGDYTFSIIASADSAVAIFAEQDSYMVVQGNNLVQSAAWDGRITLGDTAPYFTGTYAQGTILPAAISPNFALLDVLRQIIAQSAGYAHGAPPGGTATPAAAALAYPAVQSIANDTNTSIVITLRNMVQALDGGINLDAITVTGFAGSTPSVIPVTAAALETAAGDNYIPAVWTVGDIISGADTASDTALRTDYGAITPGDYTLTIISPYSWLTQAGMTRFTHTQLQYYSYRQLEGRAYTVQLHYYDDTAYLSSSAVMDAGGTITIPAGTTRLRATLYADSAVMDLADTGAVLLQLSDTGTLYQWSYKIVLTTDDLSDYAAQVSVNLAGINLYGADGTQVPDTTTNFERVIYT